MQQPEPSAGEPALDSEATWPRPRGAWFPRLWQVAVAAVLFLAMFLSVALDWPLRALDHSVAGWVRDTGLRDSEPWSTIGFLLSQTGGRGTNVVWILVLCLLAWRAHRTLVPLLRLGVAALIMWAAVYPFKNGLGRSYPADTGGDYFHAAGALGGAFPSGHQTNAILLCCVGAWIAVDFIEQRWIRRVVCWYAVLAPVIASISVLLMNYHWLTDVVAGAAIASILLWALRAFSASRAGERVERMLTFAR